MSHEFETGFFTRRAAWHQLGNVLNAAPDVEEAINQSGLDWEVFKAPLYFCLEAEGRRPRDIETPMNAIVRDSDYSVLGFSKENYELFQNHQAFEWCRPLVESDYWDFEAAGSLKEGKSCWILLKQNEEQIVPNDTLKQYLMLNWSHTGMKSNLIQPTTIRVVCQNTLNQALREGGANRIFHNSSMLDKYEDLKQYWLSTTASFAKQTDDFKRLLDMSMSDVDLEETADVLFPVPEEGGAAKTIATKENDFVKALLSGAASGHDEFGVKNTGYGAYMAISEYVEHYKGGERIKDRGTYVMEGVGASKIDETFDYLMNRVSGQQEAYADFDKIMSGSVN